AAFRMIRGARAAVQRQRDVRQLSLRSSPSFAVRWLSPRLKNFLEINPGWGARIDATPDFSNFETEAIDLDLRYGSGAWEGLHNSCIINDLVLPMCSPDYRDKLLAISAGPAVQLTQARLLYSAKALYQWNVWLAVHGIERPQELAPLSFDRSSMAIQLARDGVGVILDSATLAFEDLERGTLVPLSTAFDVVEFPAYWLVCPPRHRNRRIVRLFSEWLMAEAESFQGMMRARLIDLGCTIRMASVGEPGLNS
ncbi:transcriptional regulator, partial [Thioclava sp. BHET1]